MNCKSHFIKLAKNGASYNKNLIENIFQWGYFYSKFVKKIEIFWFFHVTPPYCTGASTGLTNSLTHLKQKTQDLLST